MPKQQFQHVCSFEVAWFCKVHGYWSNVWSLDIAHARPPQSLVCHISWIYVPSKDTRLHMPSILGGVFAGLGSQDVLGILWCRSVFVCGALSFCILVCLYLLFSLFFLFFPISLFVYFSFFLSFFLSFYLSIFLSFYLSIYLSIYLSVFVYVQQTFNYLEGKHPELYIDSARS